MDGAAAANVQEVVPFFGVSDIQESVRYDVDGLGSHVTHRWVDGGHLRWCRLAKGAVALMLQEFAREAHGPRRPAGHLGCRRVARLRVRGRGRHLPGGYGPWHHCVGAAGRQRHVGHLPHRS